MDKHFVPDVRLDCARLLDDLEEFLASALIVGVVSIDNVDERSAILDVLNGVALEHVVTGEVDHVELNVVVVADCLRFNVARWQQKESLMRRHLLKDNLADARLARSKQYNTCVV